MIFMPCKHLFFVDPMQASRAFEADIHILKPFPEEDIILNLFTSVGTRDYKIKSILLLNRITERTRVRNRRS
jgi:hypothetical protein